MTIATDLATGLAALARLDPAAAPLPADAVDRLVAYLDLLVKWNRTYNLTAIREPARMVTHHLLDALAVLPHLPRRTGLRLLDVGSGPGIPGIPLAIARPDWQVVMLDSSHKKSAFVRQAAIELGIRNAEAVTARVEDYAAPAPFDVVISRAFADLAAFAAGGVRHLAPEGRLYAMKGVHPDAEIADLPPGIRVEAAHALAVPGLDAARHLIVLGRAAARAPADRAPEETLR